MSWSETLKNRQQIRARVEAGEEIAIMFSDIRGFTAYTAREGDRAAYQLAQLHESLLKERIEGRGGLVVKTMGDGIMAAFAEPAQGVRAAVTIQQAIRVRNQEKPKEPIDVGIGLASGTPVMTEGDMIGHAVNLAQRVSSLAKGGQILTTERIKREAPLIEGLHYLSFGKQKLKGLDTEALYEVVWMAEIARLSDGEDRLTLVLTERGTVVVELARGILERLETATAGRTGRGGISSLLRRKITRFTQGVIDLSLSTVGITREQPLDRVHLSPVGKDVEVKIGKRTLRLRGVDQAAVRAFQQNMRQVKEKLSKTRAGNID